jgi:brefeldin A-inhibited guanine nucleotide-exchange protein
MYIYIYPFLLSILENEPLAHVGNSCFRQFLVDNCHQFDATLWSKFTNFIVSLFDETLPKNLSLLSIGEEIIPEEARLGETSEHSTDLPQASIHKTSPRNHTHEFRKIIVQCVLHLLLIQNVENLLIRSSDKLDQGIYTSMSNENLLVILHSFQASYEFSKKFNLDHELRATLWKLGYMKQMPNLFKQETMTFRCLFLLSKRIFEDNNANRLELHEKMEEYLIL